MPRKSLIASGGTAIALALAAAPLATMTATPVMAQQSAPVSADYSEADLDAFAEALLEVSLLREKYDPLLQDAETQEEQQSIVKDANVEMRTAIEETDGITVDDYIEIAQAAGTDDALNQRILDRLRPDGTATE